MAEILFEISTLPASPSEISYDEHIDHTLSVGRGEGKDWPPDLICQG